MYFLYSLALSVLFLALLPYFLYQAMRHGKYAGSFKQRMGWLPESLRSDGQKTIWVHAVSVGEFLAARPLMDRLNSDLAGFRIVVSTTTLTGQRLARSQPQLFDAAFYFPFDWKFAVRRALTWLKPSIVIILETELWPNFLRECRKRGVLTILANGRISPRSFRRYQRVGPFFRRVIEGFSLMVMQSEADAERARQLGARASRVRVCGNLKYDVAVEEPSDDEISNLRFQTSNSESRERVQPAGANDRQFKSCLSPHLIVAGSTALGEEEMLLASLSEVRSVPGLEDVQLLLAPRHPERFDEVAHLIARSCFTFVRRSEWLGLSGSDARRAQPKVDESRSEAEGKWREPEVILLDTIGELASIYRFAAVVFVGGSLVPRGGHNIVEPAVFAKPIVVGPHTENFRQIVSDFARADAVLQIREVGDSATKSLTLKLIRLLSDCDLALAMGRRARDILDNNRGATECTIAAIREVMRNRANRDS